MAQYERENTQEHPTIEESQELAGYTALPNLLLQELGGQNGSTYSVVLFIARHTIGRQIKIGSSFYRVKTVCLSFDEFLHGRRKRDGTRMQPPSGLPDDKAVMRGCQAALVQGLSRWARTPAHAASVSIASLSASGAPPGFPRPSRCSQTRAFPVPSRRIGSLPLADDGGPRHKANFYLLKLEGM